MLGLVPAERVQKQLRQTQTAPRGDAYEDVIEGQKRHESQQSPCRRARIAATLQERLARIAYDSGQELPDPNALRILASDCTGTAYPICPMSRRNPTTTRLWATPN